MTIDTQSSSIKYTGDGVQNVWTFDFRIPTGGLEVWLDTGTGVYALVSAGDYSVVGLDDPLGGTVTYPIGAALHSGWTICIQRALPYVQETSVSNQAFYPHTVEQMDDYATMLIQQLLDTQLGSIRGQPGDRMNRLPGAAQRMGQWLTFDTGGNPVLGYPIFNAVTGNDSFFLQGNGLGPGGTQPYNIHAWKFWETISRFQYLPARGWQVLSNTDAANAFATYRTISQRAWNNPAVTSGGFFPNGGRPYGDDGLWFEYTNSFGINSNNNLTGPYAHIASQTITGGVVTAITIEPSSVATYTFPTPPPITAFDNNGGGTGFVGTADIDGTNHLTGAVTITNGGSGYSADTVFIVESPPASTERDNGPQFELNRFPDYGPLGNNSYLGWIYWTGSTLSASAPNATYASIGTRIISNSDASPRGEMIFCTSNDFSIGSNYPRMFMGQGLRIGIFENNDDTKPELFDPLMGSINVGYKYYWQNLPFEYQGVSSQFRWQDDQAIESADPGATFGPVLNLARRSPSPAVNDQGGVLNYQFYNDAGTPALWSAGAILAVALNVTAGNEQGRLNFQTSIGGVLANKMFLQEGLYMNGATGGDQGAGTINASGVYDDGVLLTCYPVQQFREGRIDPAYWDGKVPNRHIPAVAPALRPKLRKEMVPQARLVENADGTHTLVHEEVEREVHDHEVVPLFKADGTPDMHEVTATRRQPVRKKNWVKAEDGTWTLGPDKLVYEEVPYTKTVQKTYRKPLFEEVPEQPAQEVERTHEGMRRFMKRLGTDMDPLDPDGFEKHVVEKGHLPMMPNPEKYDPMKPLSTGETIQRLVEFADVASVLIIKLNRRLKEAEAQLAANSSKETG